MKCLIFLHLLFLILRLSSSAEWCYQSQVGFNTQCKGPAFWGEVISECGKVRQSPINIVTKQTVLDERLTPFNITGYQTVFNTNIINNGHSVQVNIPITAAVSGGNLGETYKAVHFHFHWGTDGGLGSDHTIDGEQYPMELHIVHIKQKYNNTADALKDPFGLAVLGFFFKESNSPNKNYEQLIQALSKIKNSSLSMGLQDISISQFILPEENMTNYYRYDGSLTVPNCNEAVIWTVFENPIPLSKEQLQAFSSLKFSDGKPMVGTFRPTQPRNGRTVYRSSGSVVLASAVLLLTSITAAFSLSHLN